MINEYYIDEYLKKNKNLTLLNNKIPIIKNWTKKKINHEKIYNHKNNLGWVLGEKDLVIDIDPRNGGNDSFKKILIDLDLKKKDLNPMVITPSGGFHCYLQIEETNKNLKKTLPNKYPGIDFLTKGTMCVIAGSKLSNNQYKSYNKTFIFKQKICPSQILNLIKKNIYLEKKSNVSINNYIPVDKIKELINQLNPSMNYSDWLKIGMALHSWDKKLGYEIWEKWSKNGNNYIKGETQKKWYSFNENKKITIKTLYYLTKKNNKQYFDDFIKEIKNSNSEKIEKNLLKNIEIFNEFQKEKIFKTIQDRLFKINELKIPINTIKNIAKNTKNNINTNWYKDWIFINSHSNFLNIKTLEMHTQISFNTINGKFINKNKNNIKPSAVKYICDNGLVETVSTIAYLPQEKKKICEMENKKIFNIFNHNSLPVIAKNYTESGLKSINMIKKHIELIFEKKEDQKIFTYWLAHQIQFPGKKILWAPIICSIPGVGKSFLGEILKQCLGTNNVGIVSPNQVTSEFNGWANNVLINILEELRIKGRNRFEAINSLKPLITDKHIQINEKCVKQYVVKNVTNYICFTNERDSIVFDKNDRRWWVIFCPIEDLDQIKQYTGYNKEDYFVELFNSLYENISEIKKWLTEIKISEIFLKLRQAPMNDYKKSMIVTENLNIEYFFEIKELIKKGNKYFNENVICCHDLFNIFEMDHPEIIFKTIQKNIILKKLGYIALPNPQKIDGKTRRLWAKKIISNDQVRKLLNL